ncbi:restriction endonuclease subunit S [Bacillus mycoides]|uniref:restriction endonuclease subunit S n=1 Tax=Bacillus mycoides TaxID=1405 RepID=UPI001C0219F8|nr:restriction endonuclease subunit S [Bacillus mycoides]QWG37429.1 restriction endonuclease subunit S [Bacillus mycoides]
MSKNVPEVRFGGFSEEWKINKLAEIVDRVTRKNSKLESTLPLTISAQHGLVDQVTFFNKQVASKDVSNYYLLEKGEFAYNKSYSKGFPWGAVKRLDKYEKGVLSTLYIVFIPRYVNSDFLLSYYDTNRWHKEVSMRAAEGARNHGLLNITAKDFFETELKIPSTAIEQQKIGALFKQLDNMIALQQQLVEQQQQYKKAMLQKMFPQKGERVPKVRFNGFSGNWEEKKLNEVAKYRNGKAHEKNISYDGKYIVVNSKFVSTNGKVKKFSDEQIEPMYENEIAFVLSDVPNGRAIAKTFLVKTNDIYSLNQRIAGVTPDVNTDAYFLYILMNRHHYFLRFDDGVGQTNLSKNDVEKFIENYPCYKEQQKIGAFFKELDDAIALHQKKFEDYQQLKKALVQRMFV